MTEYAFEYKPIVLSINQLTGEILSVDNLYINNIPISLDNQFIADPLSQINELASSYSQQFIPNSGNPVSIPNIPILSNTPSVNDSSDNIANLDFLKSNFSDNYLYNDEIFFTNGQFYENPEYILSQDSTSKTGKTYYTDETGTTEYTGKTPYTASAYQKAYVYLYTNYIFYDYINIYYKTSENVYNLITYQKNHTDYSTTIPYINKIQTQKKKSIKLYSTIKFTGKISWLKNAYQVKYTLDPNTNVITNIRENSANYSDFNIPSYYTYNDGTTDPHEVKGLQISNYTYVINSYTITPTYYQYKIYAVDSNIKRGNTYTNFYLNNLYNIHTIVGTHVNKPWNFLDSNKKPLYLSSFTNLAVWQVFFEWKNFKNQANNIKLPSSLYYFSLPASAEYNYPDLNVDWSDIPNNRHITYNGMEIIRTAQLIQCTADQPFIYNNYPYDVQTLYYDKQGNPISNPQPTEISTYYRYIYNLCYLNKSLTEEITEQTKNEHNILFDYMYLNQTSLNSWGTKAVNINELTFDNRIQGQLYLWQTNFKINWIKFNKGFVFTWYRISDLLPEFLSMFFQSTILSGGILDKHNNTCNISDGYITTFYRDEENVNERQITNALIYFNSFMLGEKPSQENQLPFLLKKYIHVHNCLFLAGSRISNILNIPAEKSYILDNVLIKNNYHEEIRRFYKNSNIWYVTNRTFIEGPTLFQRKGSIELDKHPEFKTIQKCEKLKHNYTKINISDYLKDSEKNTIVYNLTEIGGPQDREKYPLDNHYCLHSIYKQTDFFKEKDDKYEYISSDLYFIGHTGFASNNTIIQLSSYQSFYTMEIEKDSNQIITGCTLTKANTFDSSKLYYRIYKNVRDYYYQNKPNSTLLFYPVSAIDENTFKVNPTITAAMEANNIHQIIERKAFSIEQLLYGKSMEKHGYIDYSDLTGSNIFYTKELDFKYYPRTFTPISLSVGGNIPTTGYYCEYYTANINGPLTIIPSTRYENNFILKSDGSYEQLSPNTDIIGNVYYNITFIEASGQVLQSKNYYKGSNIFFETDYQTWSPYNIFTKDLIKDNKLCFCNYIQFVQLWTKGYNLEQMLSSQLFPNCSSVFLYDQGRLNWKTHDNYFSNSLPYGDMNKDLTNSLLLGYQSTIDFAIPERFKNFWRFFQNIHPYQTITFSENYLTINSLLVNYEQYKPSYLRFNAKQNMTINMDSLVYSSQSNIIVRCYNANQTLINWCKEKGCAYELLD